MIIVVGAGLAGLTCARVLCQAGRQVLVIEEADTVGGRVRTEVSPEGYRLDRGFQVALAAYGALRRQVPLVSLNPRYFLSGLQVALEGRFITLGHPAYDPGALLDGDISRIVGLRDIAALATLAWRARSSGDAPLVSARSSTREALRETGVSDRLVDRVLAPFFGGISLDRALSSDASFFGFVLRSMVVGRIFVPAHGMQRIPEAIATALPPGALRLGTRVERVLVDADSVRGILADGIEMAAEAVVVATDAPSAFSLTSSSVPMGRRSCITAYFSSERQLYSEKRLVVNAENGLVNHLVQMTNIAPEYAPAGRHLLSATVLGDVAGSDNDVLIRVRDDIVRWFPGKTIPSLEPLAVMRVGYAQFKQPPGIYESLPGSMTGVRGLYLAGEYLHSSSLQGAIRGGEMAAAALLASDGRS